MKKEELTTKFKAVKGNTFSYFTEFQWRKMTSRNKNHGWIREDAGIEAVKEIIPAEILKAKDALAEKLKTAKTIDKEILGATAPVIAPPVAPAAIIPPVVAKKKTGKKTAKKK